MLDLAEHRLEGLERYHERLVDQVHLVLYWEWQRVEELPLSYKRSYTIRVVLLTAPNCEL